VDAPGACEPEVGEAVRYALVNLRRPAGVDAAATTATSSADAIDELQKQLTLFLESRNDPRVLDAGCGPRSKLEYPAGTFLIGLDQDETALARNTVISKAVATDLDTWEPSTDDTGSYDATVSWYVLEHVDKPVRLLAALARVTAPGGLVILAVPNLMSPKSLVAKFTPHAFHVWWRRRILGRPNAGKPGHGPHPTTLRAAIAPSRLVKHADKAGLDLVMAWMFEDAKQQQAREKVRMTGAAWGVVWRTVQLLSLGTLDARRTELLLLLRRRG
jgi:SAM-dependent methyltransferase